MNDTDIELEDLGEYEMDPKTFERVEQMIASADAELAALRRKTSPGDELLKKSKPKDKP